MLYQYVVFTGRGGVDGSILPAKHGGHKNTYDKFATLEQARAEQVRRGGVVQLVPCVHQSVIDLAESAGVTVDVLAVDVWRVCMWLQMQGNQAEGLPDDLPGYVLALDDTDGVLSGILFKSKDGQWFVNRRKSHYNPFESVGEVWSWARQWALVFGGVDGAAVLGFVLAIEAEIDRVLNPPVKRGHDRPHYEALDTFTVAHRWAVHKLLAEHYFSKVLGGGAEGRSIYASLSSLHRGEAWVYRAELEWRTHATPEKRETKREFREAVWDWKKAGDYLSGDLLVFDKAYADAIVGAEGFDLGADAENLPRMGRAPAGRMSERELLVEVVRIAGVELAPDSFEYEDRELLYESIRKVLSNMRSEHIV